MAGSGSLALQLPDASDRQRIRIAVYGSFYQDQYFQSGLWKTWS